MKNLSKQLIIAVVLALMATACQKDTSIEPKTDGLDQLNNLPVITYDDLFQQSATKFKKAMPDVMTLYYQRFSYNAVRKTFTRVGEPVPYQTIISEDGTGGGQVWLQQNFLDASLLFSEYVKDGVPFATYSDAAQILNLKGGKQQFGFFFEEQDAQNAQRPDAEGSFGTWRLPTMADVQRLADFTKGSANASFEYLWQPEVLNMLQLGWYNISTTSMWGVGSDCMIWLKDDPSWPVPSGYTKSQYPNTILRSCDYITGMGDNYTYLSIADNTARYNIRLVCDF